MDPSSRLAAWKMIEELKQGRAMVSDGAAQGGAAGRLGGTDARAPSAAQIMTTHSMEEADSLGDRIGIMGAGKLLCLGTSTLLKSTYGNGYRLNISVEDGHLPAVHERVKSELGTCTLMSTENDGEP